MNSLKIQTLSRGIAAAFVVAGVAAAIGTPFTGFAATPNVGGTPGDGMVCRSGYTPSFNGTSLKCSKTSKINVKLVCADPGFTDYVARTPGSGGSPSGLDICVRTGGQVTVGSSTNIGPGSNFTQGTDYVFAKADTVKLAQKTTARDLEEATAIGGSAVDVETESGEPVTLFQFVGIIDHSQVTLTHFAFPIKTVGIAGGPLTSPTPFVPRSLP